VYHPVRNKGVSPKLCSHWQGPGEVVAQLRWCTGCRGGVVLLLRDRLAPYCPLAPPAVEEGGKDTGSTTKKDFLFLILSLRLPAIIIIYIYVCGSRSAFGALFNASIFWRRLFMRLLNKLTVMLSRATYCSAVSTFTLHYIYIEGIWQTLLSKATYKEYKNALK